MVPAEGRGQKEGGQVGGTGRGQAHRGTDGGEPGKRGRRKPSQPHLGLAPPQVSSEGLSLAPAASVTLLDPTLSPLLDSTIVQIPGFLSCPQVLSRCQSPALLPQGPSHLAPCTGQGLRNRDFAQQDVNTDTWYGAHFREPCCYPIGRSR